jgi:hypothetical protein
MGVPLTDLASVRQFMQKTASDVAQDPDIEVLIEEVSEGIERFCDREFGPTDAETRSFEYVQSPGFCASDVLNTNPYEFRTVTKVVYDPEVGGGTEVDPNAFRPWPYPARDGTFFGLRVARGAVLPPQPSNDPFPTRRVDVTGDWGMLEVPALIKRYANMAVESALHLRRDAGPGFNEGDLDNEPPGKPDDLPTAVKWGLRRAWVRPAFPL